LRNEIFINLSKIIKNFLNIIYKKGEIRLIYSLFNFLFKYYLFYFFFDIYNIFILLFYFFNFTFWDKLTFFWIKVMDIYLSSHAIFQNLIFLLHKLDHNFLLFHFFIEILYEKVRNLENKLLYIIFLILQVEFFFLALFFIIFFYLFRCSFNHFLCLSLQLNYWKYFCFICLSYYHF
jgi:hypothetical protein